MKVFIIHGAYGNPEENWIPWLKKNLEKEGFEVFCPRFPTPENQSLENWMLVFEKYISMIDESTIFVGHSIGPAFILAVLEKVKACISACFFVSPFACLLGNPDFDTINKSFVEKKINWEKARKNCKKFFVFHSDNDPYVPLEKAEYVAKMLGAEINIIKGAGHFNKKSGYTEFKILLKKIKETAQTNF